MEINQFCLLIGLSADELQSPQSGIGEQECSRDEDQYQLRQSLLPRNGVSSQIWGALGQGTGLRETNKKVLTLNKEGIIIGISPQINANE